MNNTFRTQASSGSDFPALCATYLLFMNPSNVSLFHLHQEWRADSAVHTATTFEWAYFHIYIEMCTNIMQIFSTMF